MRRLESMIAVALFTANVWGQRLPRPDNYLIHHPYGPKASIEWIPSAAFRPLPPGTPPTPARASDSSVRASSIIRRWILEKPASERVRVLITLDEDLPELVLPLLKKGIAPEAAENAPIIQQRSSIIVQRATERQRRHTSWMARLVPGATLLESYPIANVMQAELTVGAVRDLLGERGVRYIQAVRGGEPPPQATISDGRHYMATDFWPYTMFPRSGNRDVPWERIALLDTGVRQSHDILLWNIVAAYDCANAAAGSYTCTTPATGRTLIRSIHWIMVRQPPTLSVATVCTAMRIWESPNTDSAVIRCTLMTAAA